MYVHTSKNPHRKIPSHSSKKSKSLWPVMMDDSAPILERRNSLKPTKMCSIENGGWLLRFAGIPTPKMIKSWSRKMATNVTRWQSPTGIFQIQNMMIVIASLSQI